MNIRYVLPVVMVGRWDRKVSHRGAPLLKSYFTKPHTDKNQTRPILYTTYIRHNQCLLCLVFVMSRVCYVYGLLCLWFVMSLVCFVLGQFYLGFIMSSVCYVQGLSCLRFVMSMVCLSKVFLSNVVCLGLVMAQYKSKSKPYMSELTGSLKSKILVSKYLARKKED